ncbi:MAG: glycosyltransferase 28 domain protein [Flavipsychrobacter sp.]|nr:glycosyltransferase 28 domain protein [Flavipsychrobacter sp.]
MVINEQKHILVAPLDWGLGHTTRCIPLIRHIQRLRHVPIFAGNTSQAAFIKEIFGNIECIHLDGYNITYSNWNKWAQIELLSQLPNIQKSINVEHKWLRQLEAQRKIDGIISDNRYGLFHSKITSVILTHQLCIQTGFGTLANRAIQKIHYKYLGNFNATWVVDAKDTPNLAGSLSHTSRLPANTSYIGLLSRFATTDATTNNSDAPLLILLSGPEPQRTALSRILWQQCLAHTAHTIFIEGSEAVQQPANIPSHITYHKRVAGQELAEIIKNAGMVICRSGYSTLMDLVALQKRAILIPTPGQTEQEYLGNTLHKQGLFYSIKQDHFNLQRALNETQQFPFHSISLQQHFNDHQPALENWINSL